LLERVNPLTRGLEQSTQLRIVTVLVEQLARPLKVVDGPPILGGQPSRRLELAIRLAGSGEPLPVPDHVGVRQLVLKLGQARLDLADKFVNHREASVGAPAAR